MKVRAFYLFLSLSFIALMLFNCKKNNKELSCTSEKSYETKFKTNNHEFVGRSVVLNDSNFIKLTKISAYNNPNVLSDILNLIDHYGVTLQDGANALGLAIYFSDTLISDEIKSYTPVAITIYSQKNNKMYGTTYQKNETSSELTLINELSGITTFVSSNDLSNIALSSNEKAKEIVLLLNQSQINDTLYDTELQHKIETYQRPIGGGGVFYSECASNPDCARYYVEGWCVVQERQNGPPSSTCYPKKDFCPTQSTNLVLGNNGYSVNADKNNDLYFIRDNFLVKNEKGSEYIDNYYYANSILKFENITLTFALSVWNLYENGFLHRFKTTIENNSESNVLIDNESKVLLLDLCSKAKALNNDARFQSIVRGVETDVIFFSNKSYGTIKNSL